MKVIIYIQEIVQHNNFHLKHVKPLIIIPFKNLKINVVNSKYHKKKLK